MRNHHCESKISNLHVRCYFAGGGKAPKVVSVVWWLRPTWTMYHLNESPQGVEAAAGGWCWCCLELQTKVPEDYSKFYNHGVGPY